MRPLRLLACAWIILISLSAGAAADDLIDAMVPTDPRDKLSSGTGMVYGSVYSPPDEDAAAGLEEEALSETLDLRSYRRSYDDVYQRLRSPLFPPDTESADLPPEMEEDDLFSTSVTPIPLGKPEQREGVWYEDDLSR